MVNKSVFAAIVDESRKELDSYEELEEFLSPMHSLLNPGENSDSHVSVIRDFFAGCEGLYPEHGRENMTFLGSQKIRNLLQQLLICCKNISEFDEEENEKTFLFYLSNPIVMYRIELEAQYHPEDADIAAKIIRWFGHKYPAFKQFSDGEADLICPIVKNRGHRFTQGEQLSSILENDGN